MGIPVLCYSGLEYAERPIALHWQGQRLDVEKVLDSQKIPNGKRFTVLVSTQQVFELTYDELEDQWQIIEVDQAS